MWWLIATIALVTSGAFHLAGQRPVGTEPDEQQYDTVGWNLAQGHGFSLATEAPYPPTMYREPLYPTVIGWLYRWMGHQPAIVPYAQLPVFMATCVLTYLLGGRLFGEPIGRLAGVATAGFPTLANYPSYLLTESLATFLIVCSVGLIWMAWRQQRASWWALAGVLLGLTSLCKAIMLWFVAPVALALVAIQAPGAPWGRRLAHAAVVVGCCGLVVTPWLVRNQRLFGTPQLSLRGDLALWMRAQHLDDTPKDMAQAALYNFSEYLGHRVFPEAAARPEDVILRVSHQANERVQTFMAQGLTETQANHRVGREALRRLRAHPLKYALSTPIEAIKLTAFSYVPLLNEPHVIAWFTQWPAGRTGLAILRGLVRLLAYPLLVLVGYGMWTQRARWRSWWPVGLVILYLNGVHALLFGYGRFAVPLIPFYLLFAAVGLAAWRGPARDGGGLRPVTCA